ncbi:MAG: ester cyclase [Pseudomonadota bacterium]
MIRTILAAAAAALIALPIAVQAGSTSDRATVEAFYSDLLSNPKGDDLGDRVRKVVTEDWVSVPTPRGGPGAKGMTKTLAGFGVAIPDLNWEIQEILQDGNRYIVRSFATGTPVKEVFGVEPKGKSFRVQTIDIHTVENGRITSSFHVEDWLRAKYQLSAE